MRKFLKSLYDRANYYETMAEQLENNPLLSIDYLRRAFLISGEIRVREKALTIFERAKITGRAKSSVEMLLSAF